MIGGSCSVSCTFTGSLATVQVLDPVSNTWAQSSPIPEEMYHPAGVSIGCTIYILGGVRTDASISASVYRGEVVGCGGPAAEGPPPSVLFHVYPNPFNPAVAVRGTVKFEGVPQGGTLRLYTSSGQKVWSTVSSDGKIIEWNGRNSAGSRVAPGVYWWVVEGQGTMQRGKLVIE